MKIYSDGLYRKYGKSKVMILKNTKILFVTALAFISLTSCKDQAKLDAEKKAMEEKIIMDEAKVEADALKAKEEALSKKMTETSIAAIAGNTPELSTLVSAINAAGINELLSKPGSFTVFAPSNKAFEKLPKNLTIAELAKPENKAVLVNVLKYHVIGGEITSDKLVKAIEGAKGKYTFTTVTGNEVTASLKGEQIILKDEKGNKTQVALGNIKASNGIIHVINDVLIAKQ